MDKDELKKELFLNNKNGWESVDESKRKEIFEFSKDYIDFLNSVKTEREAVTFIENLLVTNGFKNINSVTELKVNDKVFFVNREKSIYAAIIGKDITSGINIIGSHIDSPRLDLKPNPIYEDSGFAYFKTHYYGGIKKYQWTSIPLAIHGIIVKSDGTKINISIGEKNEDPILTITDLLPHLAMDQMQKKMSEGINGEDLNLLIGNIPYDKDNDGSLVKLNILKLLNDKYGIKEIDFTSSELEAVPAFRAKSLGLDESMVAGYGQDDRVCAYTSLRALLDINNPEKTSICIFADKEEIGSVGNTGMYSRSFDTFVSIILNKLGINTPNLIDIIFNKSMMLSADVDGALDPIYASVSEKNNASFLGHGIHMNKYTGSRGKSGASDANAEYVAKVRNIFETNNVSYQISELGKVDVGGGGTIAYILANKGIDVIDCGVPVLSMHSPYEVTSKFDIYEAYKGYKAFLNWR
ncbi:MAG: aminopeptidase [Firmicutes bacterium]|nr:aminopeptidase [Bacillota bacterium]